MKALRARLDRMQNLLAEAKKDIADGKDQRQRIRDKKLQGIQDQTAALKRDREEIAKISAEVGNLPAQGSKELSTGNNEQVHNQNIYSR